MIWNGEHSMTTPSGYRETYIVGKRILISFKLPLEIGHSDSKLA